MAQNPAPAYRSKLTTTDTSATSILCGGGMTIGTGAVTLVDTTGKITALSSTYVATISSNTAGKMLRANGTSYIPSTATFPDTAATAGAYLRADGTNWITSTLVLPNAATDGRVVFATAANTYGENAALSFNSGTGTLSATVFSGSGASLTNLPAASITGTVSATNGGTGLNTSGSTGVAQVAAGTWSVTTTLQNAVQDNITRLGTVTTGSFPAANLSGTTLAASVVTSSLTTVGTIGSGVWNAGAVTSSGAMTSTVSAFPGFSHMASRNGALGLVVSNTLASGTAAASTIALDVDNGASEAAFKHFSSGFTTASYNIANTAQLSGGLKGLVFVIDSGTAADNIYRWYTGSSERMRLHGSGGFSIGTTTDPGAGALLVNSTITSNSTVSGTAFIPTDSSVPTNGMYLPASNNVAFSTNSTHRMSLFSDGGLGIATTTNPLGLAVPYQTFIDAGANGGLTLKTTDNGKGCLKVWNSDTTGDNNFVFFFTEGSGAGTLRGSITYNRGGGLVAYNTTSDPRAKKYWYDLNASKVLRTLKPYMGRMKGASIDVPMMLTTEVPRWAVTGKRGAVDKKRRPIYQQMNLPAFVPLLVGGWLEHERRLAALEKTR